MLALPGPCHPSQLLRATLTEHAAATPAFSYSSRLRNLGTYYNSDFR